MNYAWDEFDTVRRLVPGVAGSDSYAAGLRALVAESNEQLFRLVEDSVSAFEQGDRSPFDHGAVMAYCRQMEARLVRLRNDFIAENIPSLVDAVNLDCSSGPIMTPQIH